MRLSSTGCFPNCVRQRNGNTSTEKSIFVLRKHRSNPPMNTDPQQRRVAPPFRAGYRQRRTLGYSCSVITSQAKLIFGVDMEMESRRSEEHTSELQSPCNLVCRLLLEKKTTTSH